MNYTVTFTEDLKGMQKKETGTYKGFDMAKLTNKIVKDRLPMLRKWISYIGGIHILIQETESGRTISEGNLQINCFSGRDNLEIKIMARK